MESNTEKFVCPICDKPYARQKDMFRHVRRVHKVYVNKRGKLKCPLCAANPLDYATLRRHLHITHQHKMEKEVLNFSSMDEFEEWKNKLHQETSFRYVRQSGVKLHGIQQKKKLYFLCHRSGFFTSSSTGRRQLKRQGSVKINCTCPSTLELTEDRTSGSVQVVYWKTHVGHSADYGHSYISSEDRSLIAGLIYQGLMYDGILDYIRQNCEGEEFKRLHLLTRKDYHNIRKTLESLYKAVAENIEQWVQEMEELGCESPVLFYKPRGEPDPDNELEENDIFLIIMTKLQESLLAKFGGERMCIDAGHGTDGYCYEIMTLLTLDESGEGWPVAFCVTNQIEGRGLNHFLNKVKEKCSNLDCQVFITIDHPAYLTAWYSIMNMPQKCLLFPWHVEKKWQQGISHLKCSPEKKDALIKSLKAILWETDLGKFENLVAKFLSEHSFANEMEEFMDYFQNNYLNRPSYWSFCHRIQWDINAGVFLETFHKAVEYIYYEGKKNKRIDSCIHALITLSRDKIFDHLMKNSKMKSPKIIKNINLAHKKAKTFDMAAITQTEANTWEVKPIGKSENVIYITRLDVSCSCELKCSACNVCVHMYSCTCADHLVNFNICVHIHACLLKDKILVASITENDVSMRDEQLDAELVDEEIETDAPQTSSSLNPNKDKIRALNKKLELLMEFSSSVTTENVSVVNNYLDMAISELKKGVPQVIPSVNTSAKQSFLSLTRKHQNNSKIVLPQVQILPQFVPLQAIQPGIVFYVVRQ